MGCVSSKRDINDRHPNVFHVWNVDELGNMLVPGQIEITESELVLYQKGKEAIRWPMRCLRRYGFDAELFSFESGRRCATGPGIYAFKCVRAEALFNLLQEHIQNSGQDDISHASHSIGNHANNGAVVVMAATGPVSNGSSLRSGSVSVSDVGNYLEPIIRHRTRSNASRDGFSRMATQSLPSNLAFSENGQAGTSVPNGSVINASPHYVNGDLNLLAGVERGSGSLSLRSPLTPPANLTSLHEYANTAPSTDDGEHSPSSVKPVAVAMDQNVARLSGVQEVTSNGDIAEASSNDNKLLYSLLDFQKNIVGVMKGSNGCRQVVLRGHSLDDNTNYAKLDDLLKQEHSAKQHLYMNVVPDGAQKKKENGANFTSSQGYSYRDHFYANVGPSGRQKSVESPSSAGAPLNGPAKENNTRQSHHQHSQSLSNHPVSRQVNYAVLDLNHRGSNSSGGSASIGPSNGGGGGSETAPTSPTSLTTPPEHTDNGALEGYATIDFNKTAALSNSVNPRLDDDESVRVTRHDRNVINDPHHIKHGSIIGE